MRIVCINLHNFVPPLTCDPGVMFGPMARKGVVGGGDLQGCGIMNNDFLTTPRIWLLVLGSRPPARPPRLLRDANYHGVLLGEAKPMRPRPALAGPAFIPFVRPMTSPSAIPVPPPPPAPWRPPIIPPPAPSMSSPR